MNDTNSDLLPLWYKEGEYPLFPIRQADADMLLFHSVWDVVVSSGYLDFIKSVTTHNFDLKGRVLEDTSCLLIFPGDEPMTKYTLPIQSMPYFVGIYGVILSVIDDEDDTSLCCCFCPEWALDGSEDIIYNNIGGGNFDLPSFLDNSAELQQAIRSLLDFLHDIPADTGSWVERMNLSQKMLAERANPLHILHNVGLYDIDALWTILLNAGLAGQALLEVSTNMTRQLHRYAMRVVNVDNPQRRKC